MFAFLVNCHLFKCKVCCVPYVTYLNVAAMNGYTDCARAVIQTFKNGQHDAVDCIDDLERSVLKMKRFHEPLLNVCCFANCKHQIITV
jgi:hypothetical protein